MVDLIWDLRRYIHTYSVHTVHTYIQYIPTYCTCTYMYIQDLATNGVKAGKSKQMDGPSQPASQPAQGQIRDSSRLCKSTTTTKSRKTKENQGAIRYSTSTHHTHMLCCTVPRIIRLINRLRVATARPVAAVQYCMSCLPCCPSIPYHVCALASHLSLTLLTVHICTVHITAVGATVAGTAASLKHRPEHCIRLARLYSEPPVY